MRTPALSLPVLAAFALALSACGGRKPANNAPDEAAAEQSIPEAEPGTEADPKADSPMGATGPTMGGPSAGMAAGESAPSRLEGNLSAPAEAKVGEPFTVSYSTFGMNGCYRQSNEVHKVEGEEIRHAYSTSYKGEICTMALVPAGFETELTIDHAGTFEGKVMIDGDVVATYELTVRD